MTETGQEIPVSVKKKTYEKEMHEYDKMMDKMIESQKLPAQFPKIKSILCLTENSEIGERAVRLCYPLAMELENVSVCFAYEKEFPNTISTDELKRYVPVFERVELRNDEHIFQLVKEKNVDLVVVPVARGLKICNMISVSMLLVK